MGILNCMKIKELREGRGLSQEEAAKLAGIGGRQQWNDVESGRRVNLTLDTLERVAKALNAKPRDLLK